METLSYIQKCDHYEPANWVRFCDTFNTCVGTCIELWCNANKDMFSYVPYSLLPCYCYRTINGKKQHTQLEISVKKTVVNWQSGHQSATILKIII